MSKSNSFETALLQSIFQNAALSGLWDALGVAGSLYFSLHTADPGEAGDQSTNECAYTGYARVAVARSAGGFTVAGNQVSLAAEQSFPIGTGPSSGGVAATHFGVGTSLSGAGRLLYKGAITPNIMTGVGVTPKLGTGTVITED